MILARRAALVLLGLSACLASAPRAHAQASSGAKVAAEALFEEGRRLVSDGKYSEACPKLAESQRLDPSVSTLLNLANCYEKLGHTATAWVTYKEAAGAANAVGRTEYVSTAQRHADSLLPRLSRLTVNVAAPIDALEVSSDGVVVGRAEWGTAIPVDPGAHLVAAAAPGHKRWESTVDVAHEGLDLVVTVPPLEVSPAEAGPPNQPAERPPIGIQSSAAASASGPVPRESPPSGAAQRVAGWIVAGLGLASVAVGGGFAAGAVARKNDSLPDCQGPNQDTCNQTGVAIRNTARTDGDVASLTLGLGAAAAVAGFVLVLSAPQSPALHPPASSWVVAPAGAGAVLRGAW